MKIAAITEDGATISQHFGRAPYYLVLTIEDGMIKVRELREKLGHVQFVDFPHDEPSPGQPHGMDKVSHHKHMRMAEAISDCQILLCRGMGRGAYESMKTNGIQPIVTDIEKIDDAVLACLAGTIEDLTDKLH